MVCSSGLITEALSRHASTQGCGCQKKPTWWSQRSPTAARVKQARCGLASHRLRFRWIPQAIGALALIPSPPLHSNHELCLIVGKQRRRLIVRGNGGGFHTLRQEHCWCGAAGVSRCRSMRRQSMDNPQPYSNHGRFCPILGA